MLLLAQKDSPSMKYMGKTLKRFHCSARPGHGHEIQWERSSLKNYTRYETLQEDSSFEIQKQENKRAILNRCR